MYAAIIIKGEWNRDETIDFIAFFQNEESISYSKKDILEKGTTTEKVEFDKEDVYFKNKFAGKAKKLIVNIL